MTECSPFVSVNKRQFLLMIYSLQRVESSSCKLFALLQSLSFYLLAIVQLQYFTCTAVLMMAMLFNKNTCHMNTYEILHQNLTRLMVRTR